MRKNSRNPKMLRLLKAATILSIGGLAAGCSSDVMRFSDSFYTSAVPKAATSTQPAQGYGQPNFDPNIDRAATGSVASRTAQHAGLARSTASPVATPHPVNPVGGTATAAATQSLPPNTSSVTTGSITPAPVMRAPVETAAANTTVPVTTSKGWSTADASRVTLRPGETVASLSKRYGVPEKAILEVNGLSNGTAVSAGQTILIPTFSRGRPTAAAKPVAAPAARPAIAAPARAALKEKGGRYTVQAGDSLSAIASKTGASVAGIKQVNNLSTDNIRIGQSLIIPGLSSDMAVRTANAPNIDPVVTGTVKKASGSEKVAEYTPPKSTAKSTSGSITKIETQDTAKAPEATGVATMRWPVQGKVISAFGSNSGGKGNDGIDISVPTGTAVKAAENGVVIYAGDGLKELGKTILIRHSDGMVTVYGHVSDLSVKRGETVRRGQQIAASGMSGSAKQPQLHFEVRKNSKPVNPTTYLQ